MFKRTESLRKKIIAACVIGLGILVMGPCAVETCSNFNDNKTRYNLAESEVKKLAEYDHINGTSKSEWRGVYNILGLEYDPKNPEKLSQQDLDNYLEKFGYSWDGKEYSH